MKNNEELQEEIKKLNAEFDKLSKEFESVCAALKDFIDPLNAL